MGGFGRLMVLFGGGNLWIHDVSGELPGQQHCLLYNTTQGIICNYSQSIMIKKETTPTTAQKSFYWVNSDAGKTHCSRILGTSHPPQYVL